MDSKKELAIEVFNLNLRNRAAEIREVVIVTYLRVLL
jgi:hypothetical protein